jgi:hypothetical protein
MASNKSVVNKIEATSVDKLAKVCIMSLWHMSHMANEVLQLWQKLNTRQRNCGACNDRCGNSPLNI